MDQAPKTLTESLSDSETPAFKQLTQEELASMTEHERSMYHFEKDKQKNEEDIREYQKEIEVLFDMAEQIPQGGDASTEQMEYFQQRLGTLKRFKEGRANSQKFLQSLLRDNKAGELPFGEQINVLQQYIDERAEEIKQIQQDRQAYLDEKYSVHK